MANLSKLRIRVLKVHKKHKFFYKETIFVHEHSKVAKKATFLDDFLARRLQLKSLEERRIELKTGIKQTPEPIPTTAKKSETNGAEEGFESMTSITSDMPQTPEDKERDLKKWLDQAKKNIWNCLIPKLNGETNIRISSVK